MHSSSPAATGRTATAASCEEFHGNSIFMFGTQEWLMRAADGKKAVPCNDGHLAPANCSSDSLLTAARAWAMAALAMPALKSSSAAAPEASIVASSSNKVSAFPLTSSVATGSSPYTPVVSSPQVHCITHSFSLNKRSYFVRSAAACGLLDAAATNSRPLLSTTWPKGDWTSTSMLLYSKRPSILEKNSAPPSNNAVVSKGAWSARDALNSSAASLTRPSTCAANSASLLRPGGGRHASPKGALQNTISSIINPRIVAAPPPSDFARFTRCANTCATSSSVSACCSA
mmetsp:Transcript_131330/g.262055  ORF Transcript_131330/g.262055 Transcript_131330/m.262055 type:complete len:287 (-) Transcript_131330:532-1392(-)